MFKPEEVTLWKKFCDAGCGGVVDARGENLGVVHRALILLGQGKWVWIFGDKPELLVCSMWM